ncbi:uncharacterized protein KGF55_001981 [Candida pseudojiufengensis]|uniref:uncharacterized protein n=1 Tax=Candida pseudojiufengensis TaxID=497109 RepID=UPI002224D052|nr:uncharacterized protein KGF55_001981 [Candida pseudojiufengensis]KAI5964910.1 hypothetical protein KGF55_001981 [Candida pseudojiufengensis]
MKYIVEHMEEGFSEWVILEYSQIIRDVGSENLILTSLPKTITEKDIPKQLKDMGLQWTTKEIIDLEFQGAKINREKIALLDPAATVDLIPEDKSTIDYFLLAGVLGEHPRKDRTGILREKYKFQGKRLGNLQMTTDTAIRTAHKIINGTKFEDIQFLDYPEIKYNKYESTEMPFRYIVNDKNEPILPEGMLELIRKDADQSIDDLLIDE